MRKARLLRGKALDMRVKKSELEQKDQCVLNADVCRCECGFDHEEGPTMVSSRLVVCRWCLTEEKRDSYNVNVVEHGSIFIATASL